MKKQKYAVEFWYTEMGKMFVEAETNLQAERKVKKRLAEFGLDGLQYGKDYDLCDREYEAQNAEKMEVK